MTLVYFFTMRISSQQEAEFKKEIWAYYQREGRSMPWRDTKDPYKIVVSEVMLQQTQVSRVLLKYPEFIRAFPSFKTLATAPTVKILQKWSGLGYNRRALYLKALSRIVTDRYKGRLPDDPNTLITFPAIGGSTAGSIIAFSYNKPTVFIETNIRRVFIHFFFSGRTKVHDEEILPLIKKTVDQKNPRRWYYALMDYGAMLAKQMPNANRKSAHYVKQKAFEGSDRKIRGEILKMLLNTELITKKDLQNRLKQNDARIDIIVTKLIAEGFLKQIKGRYQLQ